MAPLTIIPQKPKWGSSLMGVVPNTMFPSRRSAYVRLCVCLRLIFSKKQKKIVTARKNAGNVGHVGGVRDVGLSCV